METGKIIKTAFISLFVIICCQASFAQKKSKFLIAKFVSNGLSPTIIQTIKLQTNDPNEQSKILKEIGDYKFYYSLVYNMNNGTSYYFLESTNEVPGISPAGNSEYVLYDKEGNFKGKESFTGENYHFSGNKKQLTWEITKEKKTIGKYSCQKANLKNVSGVSVWFTSEIPVAIGPDIYHGLPGFVLEAETTFDKTELLSVSFDENNSQPNNDKFVADFSKNKALTINQVFTSKNNFIQMVKRQLETGKK